MTKANRLKDFKKATFLSMSMAVLMSIGCQSTAQIKSSTPVGNSVVGSIIDSNMNGYSDNIVNNQVANNQSSISRAAVNTQYESMSALEMAKQNPELSIMVEAIEAAGVGNMMRFAGKNYTIFAPNNEAFAKLFRETILTKESLLANKGLLRKLLAYHTVKTNPPLTTTTMPASNLTTLLKRPVIIISQNQIQDIGGRIARIISPNIVTKNGTVHVIDRVLFPEE